MGSRTNIWVAAVGSAPWSAVSRVLLSVPGAARLQFARRSRPWYAELEATVPHLSTLSSEIEERFLACGQALREQVELTGRLTAAGQRLAEFSAAARGRESPLARLNDHIGAQLSLSEDFAVEVERLAGSLDQHAAGLDQLRRDQGMLERSFAPMRFLQSLFRIEAATLPSELHALFQAVTAEMQRIQNEVASSFAEHAEALAATRDRALAAAAQLHADAARTRTRVAEKRREVQQALARLDAELARAADRNQRLTDAIRALNSDIDGVTLGLQYQDITRQKLEHVQAAAAAVPRVGVGPGGGSAAQQAKELQLICDVQAMQLAAVQQELEQATGAITSGLRGLGDRLDGVERDCLSVRSLQEISADLRAATGEMVDAHRVSGELLHASLQGLGAAIEMTRGFAETTTGATGTLRRLSADLLIMGLNAQVQAVRARNGSLETLSGATAQISVEAGKLALAFERQLCQASGTLTDLIQRSEAARDETRARCGELQRKATASTELREEEARANALAAEVATLLEELKQQAGQLLASIDLASFSREAIARARTVFVELSAIGARLSAGMGASDAHALRSMQDRYTMDSERDAHAAALAETGATARPSIDLTPSVAGPTDRPEPEAPAVATVTVALAETPAAAGLGDNVELF